MTRTPPPRGLHRRPSRLTALLGVEAPILLAGMAGGPTTPELVAAVSAAGGLGVFGAMGMSVDGLVAAIDRARSLTRRPIGVNVLLAAPREPSGPVDRLAERLAGYREELGLHDPSAPAAAPGAPLDLVEAALAAGAACVSVGLGDPAPVVAPARRAGVPVVAMVATVDDARRAVASGADVLVAQGSEAGGHRSNFELCPDGPLPLVGLAALVPQVVEVVDVPVVAAGGIADGRGLVAAMALGAEGAQLGTRFLLARESGVPAAYRERLATARDVDTLVTWALSGRPARGIANRLVRDLEALGAPSLGWPRQAAALGAVRRAAEARGDAELMALWCGQAAAVDPAELPAGEIVRGIMAEADATIARLAGP